LTIIEYLTAIQVMFLVVWRMLPFMLIALPLTILTLKIFKLQI